MKQNKGETPNLIKEKPVWEMNRDEIHKKKNIKENKSIDLKIHKADKNLLFIHCTKQQPNQPLSQ